MPLIGLTGGIASGKSTVARVFAALGGSVLSADEAARAVTAPGSAANRRIAEELGSRYVDQSGGLNRRLLADRVFGDGSARAALERITHPAILAELQTRIDEVRRNDPGAAIVVEAPLLFEIGMDGWFDAIVVVACDAETQMGRLCARDSLSRAEAKQRVDAQMPLAEKAARATHILWNDGCQADLESAAAVLWRQLVGERHGPR